MNHNMCLDHPAHELDLYCITCDKYICTKCLIKQRDQHFNHDIKETRELYNQVEEELNLNI